MVDTHRARLRVIIWCGWLSVVASAQFMRHRIENRTSIGLAHLETIFPAAMGPWHVVANEPAVIINPQLRESLQNAYDDTLSRAYVNQNNGQIIMLSVAYGRDQSHDKQVHKPEVCYPAQGFSIDSLKKASVDVAGRLVPATFLHASRYSRSEYVVYWIVEGKRIVRGTLEQNLRRVVLALQGIREDGLLFRVSEISGDEATSSITMLNFIDALASSVNPSVQSKLFGSGRH